MTILSHSPPSLDELEKNFEALSIDHTKTSDDISMTPKLDSPYSPSRPYFSFPSASLNDWLNSKPSILQAPPKFNIGSQSPSNYSKDPRKRITRRTRSPSNSPFPTSKFTFIQTLPKRLISYKVFRIPEASEDTNVNTQGHRDRNAISHLVITTHSDNPFKAPKITLRLKFIPDPPIHYKGTVVRPGTPHPSHNPDFEIVME